MYRIDNTSAVPSMPAPGPPGAPGWFTDGNPAAALEATIVDAWWCNILQEEIITVIQQAGIPLNKADHTQLWQALNMLFTGSGTVGQYLPLIGGTIQRNGASDLLAIAVQAGYHSRILYNVVGTRRWSVGVIGAPAPNAGEFWFVDEDAGASAVRATIALDGVLNAHYGLRSGAGISCAGDLSVAGDLGVVGNAAIGGLTVWGNATAASVSATGVTAGTDGIVSNGPVNIASGNLFVSAGAASVAGDISVGGNASLRSTVIYGSDPLTINADGATNQYARIGYYVTGRTLWRTGAEPSGNFTIVDDTSGADAVRLWFDIAGNATFNSNLTLPIGALNVTTGLATFGGGARVTAGNLQVDNALVASAAGGVVVHNGLTVGTGNIDVVSGNITASGSVTATGLYGTGITANTLGVTSRGNVKLEGQPNGTANVLNIWDQPNSRSWGVWAAASEFDIGAADWNGNPLTGWFSIAWNGGTRVAGDLTVTAQAYKPNGGEWEPLVSTRAAKAEIAPYQRGLDAILGLQPVTYRFTGRYGTRDDGKRYHGLIAEDVQGVMDELVTTRRGKIDRDDAEESDILTLDTSALKYALVNSIKQLTRRLEALERRS